LPNQKKCFSRQNTAINFPLQIDNSICHNGHRVADELGRLKILRAPRPPWSPDINLCHFWIFGDLKGKLKDRHLQDPEQILAAFQELWDDITFEELQMVFESWRDRLRWITEHDGEYFRKWPISKSAISCTSENQGTFSLLFGQLVPGLLALPKGLKYSTHGHFATVPLFVVQTSR
jgi:hypothetical protein